MTPLRFSKSTSQRDASQKAQQVAVASATSLQATAHQNTLNAANQEMAELRQALLDAETKFSNTVSAQRSFEARAQCELQLAAESAQQVAKTAASSEKGDLLGS